MYICSEQDHDILLKYVLLYVGILPVDIQLYESRKRKEEEGDYQPFDQNRLLFFWLAIRRYQPSVLYVQIRTDGEHSCDYSSEMGISQVVCWLVSDLFAAASEAGEPGDVVL